MGKKSNSKRSRAKRKAGRGPKLYHSRISIGSPEGVISFAEVIPPGEVFTTFPDMERFLPGLSERKNWSHIPWEGFLGGLLTGSAGHQMDVIWVVGSGLALPLTEKGVRLAVDLTDDRRWLEKNPEERQKEVLRVALSLKLGQELPDFDTLSAMCEDDRPVGDVEIHALSDLEGVQRQANFGRNTWRSLPPEGQYLVKVQRPLTPPQRSVDRAPWLVYNEDRTLEGFVAEDRLLDSAKALLQGKIKGFVLASVTGTDVTLGSELVDDPGW